MYHVRNQPWIILDNETIGNIAHGHLRIAFYQINIISNYNTKLIQGVIVSKNYFHIRVGFFLSYGNATDTHSVGKNSVNIEQIGKFSLCQQMALL